MSSCVLILRTVTFINLGSRTVDRPGLNGGERERERDITDPVNLSDSPDNQRGSHRAAAAESGGRSEQPADEGTALPAEPVFIGRYARVRFYYCRSRCYDMLHPNKNIRLIIKV